jgi:hypothetical protein
MQSQTEINTNKVSIIMKERCCDIVRQNVFSNIREQISLVFYCVMKEKWGKDSYNDECKRKERMGSGN